MGAQRVTLYNTSIHLLDWRGLPMDGKSVRAFLLVTIMILSGCLGATDDGDVEPIIEVKETVATIELSGADTGKVGLMHVVSAQIIVEPADAQYSHTIRFISATGIADIEYSVSDTVNGLQIAWVPDSPGEWMVHVTISLLDLEVDDSLIMDAAKPDEGITSLSMETIHELESEMPFTLTGTISHTSPSTCIITSDQGHARDVTDEGTFSVPLGVVEEDISLTITATCGQWTQTNDSRLVRVFLNGGDDMDGDGIADDDDSCPDGFGESDGWNPNPATDRDGDGCHDFEEDRDDDNDLIPDVDDSCASEIGWVSTFENDHDQDGCADATDDSDDDGDGIEDTVDACPLGLTDWNSDLYSDWDSDGCKDMGEDDDDDNDLVLDSTDSCWKGLQNWVSDVNSDFDGDGCNDATEDDDDDDDGVDDVNSTGVILDECPQTPLGSLDVDERGCAASERDSDTDGVNDDIDQCEGTPIGNIVNEVGCADLDGDGVFSNVDNCSDTMQKWTVDLAGCAVYQLPIAWSESGTGNGRFDKVAHFSLPCLDGSFYFRNEWTGDDVYIFLLKYTDSSGNSNNGDWAGNPGSLIRKLPDNTHLFYGSFDSTYHNDVTSRKTAVLNALNPDEEEKWMDRIHFIDQDASNIGGGLGDLINNWQSLSYGIDRFQRARETGSLNDWLTSGNDHTHWAYEARMYNYEFMSEIREQDPGVHVVTVVDETWHSGGWSGGYRSAYDNISIDLPRDVSQYDTLEIFHEHGCEDRRNRHSDGQGGYGGCHEWDYLAYLKICDRDNSSICGTEFMRWITTYGREGRWLTDITPYLFMLEEGDVRTFKYEGANKGLMTVKLLFSDWDVGERSTSGEQVFTGGQFNGQYNNESNYKRQHNFTTLASYENVKIVATITGHGFNQDQANCAEFCDHEHHYYLNGFHAYEWHPIVHDNRGCENEVDRGVTANQFGSWPYGRAGWCAGQDVKQWTHDISDWVDNSSTNNLVYKGLYNGQEYVPQDTSGGSREIRANVWLVWYDQT